MNVPTTPCLIPIQVNACVFDPQTISHTKDVVTEDGAIRTSRHAWAWHTPDFERLDALRTDALSRIWPQLFESIAPPTMNRSGGICLTFVPPRFFSKPLDGNAKALHPLPDRWLWVRVLRRVHDPKGSAVDEEPVVRAWIIDAGVPTDGPDGSPILTSANGQMTAMRIGTRRSLEEAQQFGPDEPRTAIHVQGSDQSANVTYAAYAPGNMNNVSCIDTLDDVAPEILEGSAISYFVVGWYRNPTRDDPITKWKSSGKTDDEIRRILGMDDPDATENLPIGNRCVFHGLVAHIDYWNPRSYLGPAFGSPQSDAVHPSRGTFQYAAQKVGFGATAEEALAALAADVMPDDANAQLSTDFFRLLKALLVDRLDAWDAPGSEDMLRQAERDTHFYSIPGGSEWAIGPAEDGNAANSQGTTLVISDEQRTLLHSLNALQAEADKTRGDFASAVETLYTSWWQSIRARGLRKTGLDLATNRHEEIARALQDEMARQQLAIGSAQKTLQSSLDAQLGPGIAVVEVAPKYSFSLPKDPAIAIRNVGTRSPLSPVATPARTLSQTALDRTRGTYARLKRAPLRDALQAYRDDDLNLAFDVLANEAALVEEAVAALHRESSPLHGFDENSDVQQWHQRNRQVQQQIAGVTFSNSENSEIGLSSLGSMWTQQPWMPLFLDWEVEWFPANNERPAAGGTLLNGRTILANRPQSMIRAQLERLEKMSTTVALMLASCRHLLDEIMDCDVLAQSLSGFHQQLLLRDDLLPRMLPANESLRDLVVGTSLAPPNLAANLEFETIRHGSIRIRRLWVVDSFGQAFSLEPTIRSQTAASGPSQSYPLAPRFLEPHRLAVDFAFAPGTHHPVRGWLLPSVADKALIVYDDRGIPLGLISRAAGTMDTAGTRWRPVLKNAPKNPGEITDPILAAFIQPLVGGPDARRRFDSTMNHIDEALARTLPPQSGAGTTPATMLGRPLALVQTRVRIERRGGAIVNPAAVTTNSPNVSSNKPVDVPIWIGARHSPEDGVIGFHFADDPATFVRTAKLVSGPPAGPPSFTLRVSDASDAVSLVLLVDPHGTMSFESDVLPLTTLRLPTEWIDDTLQKLPAVVRVAPALIHSHGLLRSVLDPGELLPGEFSTMASIDLPLPIGSTNAGPTASSAILSANNGIDVPVKPLSANATPELQVAALEGFLVFS